MIKSDILVTYVCNVVPGHLQGLLHDHRKAVHDTGLRFGEFQHILHRQAFVLGHGNVLDIGAFDLGPPLRSQVSQVLHSTVVWVWHEQATFVADEMVQFIFPTVLAS